MEALTLEPIHSISGVVRLPGSKSISNRVLLLSALARGETRISNLMDGEDGQLMLAALEQLGVGVRREGDEVVVVGCDGPLVTRDVELALDLGLAGTALRPLTAALTLGKGAFLLDGSPRMRERPIAHLVDALVALGADVGYAGAEGFPPVRVRGTGLRGGEITLDGSISSQFLTAVLMVAPYAERPVTIRILDELVSRPYVDLTLGLMRTFGVTVESEGDAVFRVPTARYSSPGSYMVEADASAASYFLAAGAIRGEGVRVVGLGTASLQGDVAFADTLAAMGATVETSPTSIEVRPGRLVGIKADLNAIPDAAMTIAVLALFAAGPTEIRNVYNWRVKETDRLAAMATELRKLGADVVEGRDFLRITPPDRIRAATIDTYGDHRMAMCFSLAALGGAPITINDPGCVAKTFPDYFRVLRSLAA